MGNNFSSFHCKLILSQYLKCHFLHLQKQLSYVHGISFFQLLEELCAIGRDPKNIGYKNTSNKSEESETDGASQPQGSITRSAQMGDEPMSDEDDEDEDRFSFTSTTSSSKAGLDADKDKDTARYLLSFCK